MPKSIKDYVLETPKYCEDMLNNRNTLVKNLVDLFCAKPYEKIVLVASGSSYNIAMSASYFIQDCLNVKVDTVYPATYIYHNHDFNEKAFIMCMTQSGKSTNTINALLKAKELGSDAVVLCANPNGPVKDYSDKIIAYGAGHNDNFVAKGVPTSILFLMLFALEAGTRNKSTSPDRQQKYYSDLNKLIKDIPTFHKSIEAFYTKNKEEFFNMQRTMITGIGSSYGSALEGALKLSETTGIPSNAYEVEEFMHGPVYEVNKDYALFIIDCQEQTHSRAVTIFNAASLLTDKVYLLSSFSDQVGKRVLNLNANVDQALYPLVFPVPFQILANNICEDLAIQAINLSHHKFAQQVITKL